MNIEGLYKRLNNGEIEHIIPLTDTQAIMYGDESLDSMLVLLTDTGWIPFTPIDPRIGLEGDAQMEYRRVGAQLFFRYKDGAVFLGKTGTPEYPIISAADLSDDLGERYSLRDSSGSFVISYPLIETGVRLEYLPELDAVCFLNYWEKNFDELILHSSPPSILLGLLGL